MQENLEEEAMVFSLQVRWAEAEVSVDGFYHQQDFLSIS